MYQHVVTASILRMPKTLDIKNQVDIWI